MWKSKGRRTEGTCTKQQQPAGECRDEQEDYEIESGGVKSNAVWSDRCHSRSRPAAKNPPRPNAGCTFIAEMLEKLDKLLSEELGPKWWVKTEIEQFAPKSK
jgi:hypothetical protein